MNKPKIMTVFGTRPEAIKMSPVIKTLQSNNDIEPIVTVTAQHREMLDQVLDLFNITPNYDLDIMKSQQSLTGLTLRVLRGMKKVYEKAKPDLVLVHGDTSTTLGASLAAFYNQIKVGHIEAGLRTYDKYSPFPEEMNRHLTGVIADLHFAPTKFTKKNLLNENIKEEKIFVTGNTVIDALFEITDENYIFENKELANIDFENKKIILLTAHRRENLGEPMEKIFKSINKILDKNLDVEVVYPIHLNPFVREKAEKILGDTDRVHLIEPLDYEPFVNLMKKSYIIMTDSGGIQEEAPSLGIPVLVLRDKTERHEALKVGTVKKVGTNQERIIKTTNELLNDKKIYNEMSAKNNPYGNGIASKMILNVLLKKLSKNVKCN